MSEIKIVTNGHRYPVVYGFQIPMRSKWRREHNWMKKEAFDDCSFVRYRRWLYPINEFMRVTQHAPDEFKRYDGYSSDTFFSGILIKFDDEDTDYVKMATYYS